MIYSVLFTPPFREGGAVLCSILHTQHTSPWLSKENISILLNNLTELFSSPKNSRKCTTITLIALIYIFYFFGQMLIIIGYCWSIFHKMDHVTFSQVLIYGIIFTLALMWCIGPIVVTVIIFIGICEHLISWIKDIRYYIMMGKCNYHKLN